jgi:hypothetical protein
MVALAVDDILRLMRLSKLLLLLWLSRLFLPWLHRLQLLRLNWLPLLARRTAGCQLADGEMTSSALLSDMMDVNHLQFRNQRV